MVTIEMEFAQEHVFTLVICAGKDATLEEVKAFAEKHHPAGTANGWQKMGIVKDSETKKEYNNPCVCDIDQNRQHWILTV